MLWAIVYAYIVLLCALVIITFRRGEPMRRTVWTIFAVMLLGYAYQLGLADTFQHAYPWGYSAFMIPINAIACRIIVRHPATRWQSVIGWSLVLQIGTDAGNVASWLYYGSSDGDYVYWATTCLAYAQLFMIGGWWLDGRSTGIVDRRSNHPALAPSRNRGVA